MRFHRRLQYNRSTFCDQIVVLDGLKFVNFFISGKPSTLPMLFTDIRHFYQRLLRRNPNIPLYLDCILYNFIPCYTIHCGVLVLWLCSNDGLNKAWTADIRNLRNWYAGFHENRMAVELWVFYHGFVRFHLRHWCLGGVIAGLATELIGFD